MKRLTFWLACSLGAAAGIGLGVAAHSPVVGGVTAMASGAIALAVVDERRSFVAPPPREVVTIERNSFATPNRWLWSIETADGDDRFATYGSPAGFTRTRLGARFAAWRQSR